MASQQVEVARSKAALLPSPAQTKVRSSVCRGGVLLNVSGTGVPALERRCFTNRESMVTLKTFRGGEGTTLVSVVLWVWRLFTNSSWHTWPRQCGGGWCALSAVRGLSLLPQVAWLGWRMLATRAT